jgi:ATP-dependent Clp protease protease subunit
MRYDVRMKSEKDRSGRLNPGPSVPGFFPEDDERRTPWEMAVCGDLTDRQSDLIDQMTAVRPGSRGIVYFDSCGGSVYTGLALATLIRTRGLRVTGVVIGECSSAALLPLGACRKRLVTVQSTLLFHPMRWQSEEDVRLEEATEWARHFKQLETELDQVLSRMFQLPVEVLRQWTRPGRFVTGPEIAAAGVATLYDPFECDDPWSIVRNAAAT